MYVFFHIIYVYCITYTIDYDNEQANILNRKHINPCVRRNFLNFYLELYFHDPDKKNINNS